MNQKIRIRFSRSLLIVVYFLWTSWSVGSFGQEATKSQRQANPRANRQQNQLPEPTFADVNYGPHERNVLDFWQVDSDSPTPLIVHIHGGGFVAGDKRALPPQLIAAAKKFKFSVASINYRFVGNGVIFPAPQHDGARAIQFLRSKAGEWKIDPDRIAAFGGSAGAGISLWLGFHDDLANLSSNDPIERESSRVVAIGSIGGQSTYDPIKIKELIGGRAWEHPSLLKVYGLKTNDEALHPNAETQASYDEASAITHLTRDDPPVFMLYSEPDEDLPDDARPGQGIHHPRFARHLSAELDRLHISWTYRHSNDGKAGQPQLEMLEFFKNEFDKVSTR